MDITALKAELAAGHPDTGAYDADSEVAAGQLNAVNRTKVKDSMTGDAVFAATDAAEFGTLIDHKQVVWLAFCGRSEIDPAGVANVALVNWVFGASSVTLTALAAARKDAVSRAVELGIGWMQPGNVAEARK